MNGAPNAAYVRAHGTRAKYVVERCHCQPCRRANTTYEIRNRRQRAYGRVDLVDAAPARAHLIALGELGVGYKRAAHLAGITSSSVARIRFGRTARVHHATAEAILAVRRDPAAGALVDAGLTWRRVQHLVALGWPQAWIARQLGHAPVLQLCRVRVTARNARAIAELVGRVGYRLGPSTHARMYAQRHGWAPLEPGEVPGG